ncbi:ComEA family DNA-binding protein [Eikenella corrodens]|uniref:ComEA family DNA-binding protein n=1 Tax=Eikenella corrodens TaxID=539 RepID=UPI0023D9B74A|nr:ComEA family DNA-binding protein [Eikenella corrodens]
MRLVIPFFTRLQGVKIMKKFLFVIVSLLSFSWALAQVNINTATAQELQTLNGIGPAKAAAIVEYRTANGPFKSPEDIKNVRGIGNGIYQKISSEITVGNGQTARTPAARPATQQQQPQPAAAKPATPAAKPATSAAKPSASKPAATRPAANKPAAANP